ncbi:lipoate--protein ligase [Mycoplasma phocoenae]|uniref:lipoate--protein ligase n=1 Tax=Mycoplasma phocoenae TaxID=754517 RepID=A0A858U5P7_9MOLU|nr:lipoate--protein ligase [Mycoplasma phocoenae]QJG66757.1 lipoate--protein ligase [Mycoplasma phocoenae]
MKIYLAKKYTPYYTLVMEELLINDKDIKEDIVYIYQHENAVIIGRNQNVHEEVKIDELNKNNVKLARRLSGGGAVYHDLGNINFSFITNKSEGHSYEKFLQPILEFLQSIGVNAYFKGRNDLVIDDLKFSGNAQYVVGDRIVHHGTILFNADLQKLGNYLIPSKLKMESKGIKSARQRVTNVVDVLKEKMTVEEFIHGMISFFEKKGNCKVEDLPKKYDDKFEELSKYRQSNEWLFKKQFPFSVTNEAKYDAGILKVKYSVKENVFENLVFEGDFLALTDHDEAIKAILNTEYNRDVTRKILKDLTNIKEMFGGLTIEEILLTIYGE